MEISVRLSAGLAQFTGNPRLSVHLPEGATVADLLEHLRRQHPDLEPRLSVALPVISGRHVPFSEPLDSGQELALLLPISGGSR